MFLNLMKMKKTKLETELVLSQIQSKKIVSLFTYITTLQNLLKRSFDSKRNDFIEFMDKLELFYHETLGIKPNDKDQKRDLEK